MLYLHFSEENLQIRLPDDVYKQMLLRVYYLYEKSLENKSQLSMLKEVFEFPHGSTTPARSQGYRWITHKRKALQRVIDRYGASILLKRPLTKPFLHANSKW